jgi:S-adenosylmethionine-diacylglycerol 3-amino-3-carboxypropyl transferase
MALLGVPRSQIKLILDTHPGGMVGFVQDRMRHVMTELPFHENHFWRVYMTGRYARSCCPNYLRESNLETLRQRVDRLQTHTCTVSGFLQANPGAYTHFILLDHQDWLAAHLPEALREEWELIFANAAPGATVLLRSANPDLRFVPEDIRARVDWDDAASERLHLTDRVGTYASMHVGRIR